MAEQRRPPKNWRSKPVTRPTRVQPERWVRRQDGLPHFLNDDSDNEEFYDGNNASLDQPAFAGSSTARGTAMDEAEQYSGNDGGGGGGGNVGASGVPAPLMHPQHTRRIDHKRLKFGGVTWVNSANDGVNDNLWSNFPWEWVNMFTRDDVAIETFSSHLYWRATGLNIEFKSPAISQTGSTSATGVVQNGTNIQAQVYSYLDVNWITGIASGPRARGYTEAECNSLVASWDNHGYNGGTPLSLETTNLPTTALTPSYPDVKNSGMGPGQCLRHGWKITDKHWRATGELLGFNQSSPTYELVAPAWDQRSGYIGSTNVTPASCTIASTLALRNNFNRGVEQLIPNAVQCIPMAYRSPDPIPSLWLTVQPQLASLTAGVGQSKVAIQFEMSVDVALTGRVPRVTNSVGFQGGTVNQSLYRPTPAAGTQLAGNVPLFYPANFYGL